ncbi:MAG: endonuclease domain-containing protein [Bauldia sp.]
MPRRKIASSNRRFAKTMRREMTEAEALLWRYLRKPGIGELRFRRQTPIGPYIVDFFCPQRRLIVEVDGGQHGSPDAAARDADRDTWLGRQGYRLLRVWNNGVIGNIEGVCAAILAAANSPPPEIR